MKKNKFVEQEEALDADELERREWLQEDGIPYLAQGETVQHVELEAHVDLLLQRGRDYLREYAHNEALYQKRREEMLRELEDWRDRVQAPLERKLRWLEGMLQPLFRMLRTGKKKSKALPNGVIGVRMRQAQVEIVDKEAAVMFCEANDLPLKKEPYKKPLKDFILSGGKLPKAAGIVFTPAQEDGTFYWKTPEHELLKKKSNDDED